MKIFGMVIVGVKVSFMKFDTLIFYYLAKFDRKKKLYII